MSYLRGIEIDRARVNEETGEFRAVLFTDGEASDGHILSIEGGRIPDQIPLFVNHTADPRTQVGSLFFERKTPHQVHMRGQVFLDGTGPEQEIRRDLMAKIAAGHVARMSGRWDAPADKVKPRAGLAPEHPAYVDGAKAKGPKRYGMFFEEWTAMEGSIVGLGADPQATMRWAEDPDATEAVRGFWRGVAEAEAQAVPEPTDEPDPMDEALTLGHLEPLVERIAEALRGVNARMDALEALVVTPAPAPPEEPPAHVPANDQERSALLERISALEGKLSALEEGREQGAPSPPVSVHDLFEGLRLKIAEDRREALVQFRAAVAQKRGKLDDAEQQRRAVVAQAEAEIRSAFGISEESPDELVRFSDGAVAAEILQELRKRRP